VADCDKAISISPNSVRAYSNRGRALRELGKYEESLKDLNKALELDNSFVAARFNRGETYKALADKDLKVAAEHGYTSKQQNQ